MVAYLSPRDTEEANRHEHSGNGDLVVAKFDAVKILHTQTICRDQAVESENLVHLYCGDQSTPPLADNMGN